ncbi:MAG: biotin/lipoyl-binding protein [Proteobacteria bacterium]|nr:biotin/lipoyl-binding protein [Pseudomonadota bacterium]
MRRSLYSIAILAVAGAAVAYTLSRDGEENVSYRFAQVERGDIVSAISTSGTVSAVVTVDVGTQVSGQISELRADFNTEVKRGQLIGRIDPRPSRRVCARRKRSSPSPRRASPCKSPCWLGPEPTLPAPAPIC